MSSSRLTGIHRDGAGHHGGDHRSRPTTEDVQIDAVLAENDSTALGVAAALQAKSYDQIPVSGQDGDPANLNNVALGWQYVDVWKNSNELGKAGGEAALQLCAGTAIADVDAAGRPAGSRRWRRTA